MRAPRRARAWVEGLSESGWGGGISGRSVRSRGVAISLLRFRSIAAVRCSGVGWSGVVSGEENGVGGLLVVSCPSRACCLAVSLAFVRVARKSPSSPRIFDERGLHCVCGDRGCGGRGWFRGCCWCMATHLPQLSEHLGLREEHSDEAALRGLQREGGGAWGRGRVNPELVGDFVEIGRILHEDDIPTRRCESSIVEVAAPARAKGGRAAIGWRSWRAGRGERKGRGRGEGA